MGVFESKGLRPTALMHMLVRITLADRREAHVSVGQVASAVGGTERGRGVIRVQGCVQRRGNLDVGQVWQRAARVVCRWD